ncbi:MAG: hypothetical protein ABIF09_17435 [Gemmatimonadota bacterium]
MGSISGTGIGKDLLELCGRAFPLAAQRIPGLQMVLVCGTITLELTALRRPFLFFPIEGHSEQEVHVAGRLARHGAGMRMACSATSAEGLAAAIIGNLGLEAR